MLKICSDQNKNDANTNKMTEMITNHFLKIFDAHFLTFISARQQRDAVIITESLTAIASLGDFKKDVIKNNGLNEDFFSVNKNKLSVAENLFPINQKTICIQIEAEIAIIKAFDEFFKFINKQLGTKIDISSKLNKVAVLTDKLMLERITKSKELQEKIVSKLEPLKDFDEVFTNEIFLEPLKKEEKMLEMTLK